MHVLLLLFQFFHLAFAEPLAQSHIVTVQLSATGPIIAPRIDRDHMFAFFTQMGFDRAAPEILAREGRFQFLSQNEYVTSLQDNLARWVFHHQAVVVNSLRVGSRFYPGETLEDIYESSRHHDYGKFNLTPEFMERHGIQSLDEHPFIELASAYGSSGTSMTRQARNRVNFIDENEKREAFERNGWYVRGKGYNSRGARLGDIEWVSDQGERNGDDYLRPEEYSSRQYPLAVSFVGMDARLLFQASWVVDQYRQSMKIHNFLLIRELMREYVSMHANAREVRSYHRYQGCGLQLNAAPSM